MSGGRYGDHLSDSVQAERFLKMVIEGLQSGIVILQVPTCYQDRRQ